MAGSRYHNETNVRHEMVIHFLLVLVSTFVIVIANHQFISRLVFSFSLGMFTERHNDERLNDTKVAELLDVIAANEIHIEHKLCSHCYYIRR